MLTQRTKRAGSDVDRSIAILKLLFGVDFAREFSVRLFDGTTISARETERFTFAVNAPFALRAAFLPPLDLNPGRAFAAGWIDLEGDVEAGIDACMTAIGNFSKPKFPLMLARLLALPKPPVRTDEHAHKPRGRAHTKARDAEAIGFHYNQPTSFYRLFLGEDMVYSCGYFDEGVATLAAAQTAKIDYILKKVGVRPGETLLDIGCGWGTLAIRAAQKFGARVLGVTLSREQHGFAQERIAEANLGDRVSVELRDYRDLRGRTFDRIVSVGMVEHVGREQLANYFKTAYSALKTGGLFLNHGIAQLGSESGYRVSGFIARYVFPDGDLLPIAEMTRAAERAGFELRDVENLREHYARTLQFWVANLERNRAAAIAASDEHTFRIWRLYMAGSAQGFNRGRMALYQSLLAKPSPDGTAHVPTTRRGLYA